jgi:hypothetical protein
MADGCIDFSITDGYKIPSDSSGSDAEQLYECSRRAQITMMGMTVKETSTGSLKYLRKTYKCEPSHTKSDSQLSPVIGKHPSLV